MLLLFLCTCIYLVAQRVANTSCAFPRHQARMISKSQNKNTFGLNALKLFSVHSNSMASLVHFLKEKSINNSLKKLANNVGSNLRVNNMFCMSEFLKEFWA